MNMKIRNGWQIITSASLAKGILEKSKRRLLNINYRLTVYIPMDIKKKKFCYHLLLHWILYMYSLSSLLMNTEIWI